MKRFHVGQIRCGLSHEKSITIHLTETVFIALGVL